LVLGLLISGFRFSSNLKKIPGDVWATLLLFLLTLDMYHPGLMTHDSVLQMGNAVTGLYDDGHPPLMSFVWHLANKIYFGPMGMLVLQNCIFWTGLFFLGRTLFKKVKHRIYFSLCFAFFPPIFSQLGTIWSDVALSTTLFLTSVVILKVHSFKRRWAWPLTLFILLFYAEGVRHNSAPAVIIFCFWIGIIFFRKRPHRLLKAAGFGILAFGILFILNSLISAYLVEDRKQYAFQDVAVFDLAALSISRNELILPSFLKNDKSITFEKIKTFFRPEGVGVYYWDTRLIPWTTDVKNIHELTRLWVTTIVENPVAYLKHRARYFEILTGLKGNVELSTVNDYLEPNPYGIYFRSNWIWRGYFDFVRQFRNSFLFRGYTYLILTFFVMISSACVRPFARDPFLIALSGLAYETGYFFFGPSSEFRYLYWSVLASLLAAVLLAHRRLTARPSSSRN
jgi:hypothetical protein